MPDKNVEVISIPVVLSKKIDGVLYNLMVRTTVDQVYDGEYTLTEILSNLRDLLSKKTDATEFKKLKKRINTFFSGAPEDFQTIMDIYNYINNGVNTQNEAIKKLEKILTQKVDSTTYANDKLLISNQIGDIKKDLLDITNNMISSETFETRMKELEDNLRREMNKNILASDTLPSDLIDGGFWIQTLE